MINWWLHFYFANLFNSKNGDVWERPWTAFVNYSGIICYGTTLNAYTKKSVLNRKLTVNDIFVIFGATLGKTDIWHEKKRCTNCSWRGWKRTWLVDSCLFKMQLERIDQFYCSNRHRRRKKNKISCKVASQRRLETLIHSNWKTDYI